MIAKAFAQKNRRISYIAPTYQQARDIAWAELLRQAQPLIHKVNESRLELKIKTQDRGISLITLRGWESVETARGTFNDFLVLDEVSGYKNFWLNWQEVLRPTLTDRKGEVMFISTPKGFNHFFDLYNLENTDKDFKSFHFTSYDNPFLPEEELDKARAELTEDRFAQEYLADFRKTEGLVYKDFSRDRHLYSQHEIESAEYIAGIDFGFTNPAAVLSIRRDKDDNYWVEKEWYKTGRTDAQVAEYVASCGFNRVYPDPESPGAIEALNQKGVSVSEVVKGKDSVANGISKVRELFKQNRLHIHKDCVALISELETYSYPDKKPDHNEQENPIKENDHALDSLRYAIMGNQPQGIISREEILERSLVRQRALINQSR